MDANQKLNIEFIQLYQTFPQLWEIKNEIYKDRSLRNVAFNELINKCKEIQPNAITECVQKRKKNCLRTAFRRELKKEKQSEKSGAGVEDIYIPSLYYFDELSFIRNQEIPAVGRSSLSMNDSSDDTNVNINSVSKMLDIVLVFCY